MKNILPTLLLLIGLTKGFSQNPFKEFPGRMFPLVKKEKINEAKLMSDIIPDYPKEYYSKILNYVSVDITTISDGKMITSKSKSDVLTDEQKNSLVNADLGRDVIIEIKFQYKDPSDDVRGGGGKIKSMNISVTVVPETEAEYPGGFKQIPIDLAKNVLSKISDTITSEKVRLAIVTFAVNEEGKIVDAKITTSSTDEEVDKLLLEATNKMQNWTPAQNSKGTKIKQEFCIRFRGGC